MADDTKPKMPPGFRWEQNDPRDYGVDSGDLICPASSDPICRGRGRRAAIALAHAIVRPAVEAATAELRAELDRYRRDHEAMEALRDGRVTTLSRNRRCEWRAYGQARVGESPDPAEALRAASRGEGE